MHLFISETDKPTLKWVLTTVKATYIKWVEMNFEGAIYLIYTTIWIDGRKGRSFGVAIVQIMAKPYIL